MKHYSLVVVFITLYTIVNGYDYYEWYPVFTKTIPDDKDASPATKKDTKFQDPNVSVLYKEMTPYYHEDDISSGAIIEARLSGSGACSGPDGYGESHVFAYIHNRVKYYTTRSVSDFYTKWDKIAYTLEFWASSACWSILGNTHYGSYDNGFKSGLIEFDINNENDQILSNKLKYGLWTGETKRCDTDYDNFWYWVHLPSEIDCDLDRDSCYYGSLRVEQRRDPNAINAGIGVGLTCADSNTAVRISSIKVGYKMTVP